MALTVNNINTLSLLNIVNRTSTDQANVLQRLATGSKINRGADDPAGLLALKSLGSELTAVNSAIASNQRTDTILGVADSALGEVSKLIGSIQQLAEASANEAGLSAAEKAANQAQIDDAINSIDRIIRTTNFNGLKLLDGSQAIRTSGVAASAITDVRVFSRATSQTSASLSVQLQSGASQALVNYASTSASENTTISVQGKLGTAIIEVASTENLSSVAYKINQTTAQTGVSAYVSSTLYLRSKEYGAGAFVRVNLLSGDSTNYASASGTGVDAQIMVNGQKAAVDGKTVSFASNGVSLTFEITDGFNQASAGTTSSFYVTTGGATFQLGGDATTRSTLGIDGAFASQLGTKDLGYLSTIKSGGANSIVNDASAAAAIARKAAEQVATLQGRIGGFQKFQVRTSLNSLNEVKEGLERAKSVIGDVDYATETAELNRQNVLLQSAISLLGLANQQSSQVLSLLR
jgi:flagellin